MNIDSILIKPITETKYLSAENCWRYRAILRVFYYKYEKIKYWLYKEEVLEELKKSTYFSSYSLEMCQQDLDMLVTWGNLVPVQDTSRAATIEEFKNKQFRYQMTEYAVEIERLTVKLENLFIEGASLEPTLFERIRDHITKINEIEKTEPKAVANWWKDLHTDFKRLNQNYQDYIRSFYSKKAQDMMKTTEFIAYKDTLVEYLRDFVKGLQRNAYMIENVLNNLSENIVKNIVDKVFSYEKSIPRLESEISDELLYDNIYGKWISLMEWFVGTQTNESEAAKVYDITNEIIRKITRYASQIAESRTSAVNRREEYRKLADMFMNCEDIDEAQKLSAIAFGLFNSRHIKGHSERVSESSNSSVYDEAPATVEIRPKVRGYSEKSSRTPISFKTEQKNKMREIYIRQLKEDRLILESYIKDNVIDFKSLPVIQKHVRITLLRWIAKAIVSQNKTAKTEDGRVFKLLLPTSGERMVLRCEDGELDMPAYKLQFNIV